MDFLSEWMSLRCVALLGVFFSGKHRRTAKHGITISYISQNSTICIVNY